MKMRPLEGNYVHFLDVNCFQLTIYLCKSICLYLLPFHIEAYLNDHLVGLVASLKG